MYPFENKSEIFYISIGIVFEMKHFIMLNNNTQQASYVKYYIKHIRYVYCP